MGRCQFIDSLESFHHRPSHATVGCRVRYCPQDPISLGLPATGELPRNYMRSRCVPQAEILWTTWITTHELVYVHSMSPYTPHSTQGHGQVLANYRFGASHNTVPAINRTVCHGPLAKPKDAGAYRFVRGSIHQAV